MYRPPEEHLNLGLNLKTYCIFIPTVYHHVTPLYFMILLCRLDLSCTQRLNTSYINTEMHGCNRD